MSALATPAHWRLFVVGDDSCPIMFSHIFPQIQRLHFPKYDVCDDLRIEAVKKRRDNITAFYHISRG